MMKQQGLSMAMNAKLIGSGEETLVLAHGYGADQSIWDKVLPHLTQNYQVLVFDWSFAGTIKDPDLFDAAKYSSYDAFADDLVALMDEMKLSSSVFVGHSMSGMVGCIASIKRPQLFKRLVLVGSSPRYINSEDYEGGFEESVVEQLLTSMESNYLQWTASFAAMTVETTDPSTVEAYEKCLRRMKPEVALPIAKVVFLSDHRGILEKVTTPCTIVHTKKDVAVPDSVPQYMVNKINAKSVIEIIDSMGHFPHLNAHTEFVNVIDAALNPKS